VLRLNLPQTDRRAGWGLLQVPQARLNHGGAEEQRADDGAVEARVVGREQAQTWLDDEPQQMVGIH
jgi:hypothetical protein